MIAKAPIAVLSFNRPDYLDQTLRSLAAQGEESLADREIHLFQDGMFNRFSGRAYGAEQTVLNNVARFRELFPWGQIHIQEANLGIALHFDFMERYLFETRDFEAAIFFEDDMLPWYNAKWRSPKLTEPTTLPPPRIHLKPFFFCTPALVLNISTPSVCLGTNLPSSEPL